MISHSAYLSLQTFFTAATNHLTLRGRRILTPLSHFWTQYYPRVAVAFGAEAVIIPPSFTLTFIIHALLAFVEIKSQSLLGFPFQTHPRLIMFSVTSLLVYGFASAVEFVVSAAGFDPTSVYVLVSRLGRIGSLCALVVSLATLFYF
ncbi:hypothetical protein QVD17_13338 [Tagetes erecta]|uniref:Uncharacterized protein n=1 Tax=Tagetes erecta TaxID=13708 RepID=A0AAD8KVS3_TARER|nr:hypothetical protein QVD17_13338 [Tagetes erecta]